MDTRTDTWIIIVVVVGVVALLLGCCVGALGGAIVGGALWTTSVERRTGPLPVPPAATVEPRRAPVPLPEEVLPGAALVESVLADGPAGEAGLRPGDLIVAIDGRAFAPGETLTDRLTLYEPRDRVRLTILRDGRQYVISVRLDTRPGQPRRAWLGAEYAMVPREEPGAQD